MKNFTKMKSWLMLVVFGLMFTMPSAFATGNIVDPVADVQFPVVYDMGPVAKGDVWTPYQTVVLTNTSAIDAVVTSIDLESSNEYFVLGDVELPATLLPGETLDVPVTAVFPIGIPGGVHTIDLVAAFGDAGKGVTTCELQASAYVAQQGDIFESAIPLTWLADGVDQPLDAAAPGGIIRHNYDVGTLAFTANKDVVYKFTVDADAVVSFTSTAGTDFQYTIYNDDFDGAEGPMADNYLATGSGIVDLPLFEGVYYAVITYNHGLMGTNPPSTWGTYNATTMTVPAAVLKVSPADESIDIINGDVLTWTYTDNQAAAYRVLLSTELPLNIATDVVVEDVAGATGDSYVLTGLDNNQVYFWRVDVANNVGITEDPNSWAFTTELNVPLSLELDLEEAFEGDDIVLSWSDPFGGAKALIGYNVYKNGVLLTPTPIMDSPYTDMAVTYNMAPGWSYEVSAVYDEGESDLSDPVVALVSGYGDIDGIVTDFTTGLAIEGAMVAYDGLDEFSNTVSGSVLTDALGAYLIEDLKIGVYDIDVTAAGYDAAEALAEACPTAGLNFALVEEAYPVTNVVAVEESASVIEVTWDLPASKELVNFDVERVLTTINEAYVGSTTVVGNTTGAILLDEDWDAAALVPGVYQWQVRANYTDTQSEWVLSNKIDRDMYTEVEVTVTTEFGDDPLATVTFTNTSEPALVIEYVKTLDATGNFTFEDFRKGKYNWKVELEGYMTQSGVIDIWSAQDLDFDLMGGTPPAQNLMADNDSLYLGEDVVLTWEPSASSQFQGYMVYKNNVAQSITPQAELTYTDLAPSYNMAMGHKYYVTTWYDGVESAPSNNVYVKVTGEGAVAGHVMNGMDDSDMKDVNIRLVGFDEYGVPAQYEFSTDADGEYNSAGALVFDGVLAGDYEVEVTKEDFAAIDDAYTVLFNTVGTHDYVMFPGMTVVAQELDADNVQVTWSFDNAAKDIVNYDVYRSLWTEAPASWEYLGLSYGQIFIDDAWGTVDYGAYKWAVVANYDDGTSVAYSNVLLKDMEASADITVTLNTLESPEGTAVDLKYVDGFMDTTYTAVLDATGMFTFAPIYKGDFEIKVQLFGYETLYSAVEITSDTAFAFELIEKLDAVSDLYVTPRGYATWGVAQAAALDMYSNDFVTEPTDIEITYEGTDVGENGKWYWSSWGEEMAASYSSSTGMNDTRFTLPRVLVTDETVIEFAFYFSVSLGDTELYLEVSNNEGLSWTTVRMKDLAISAGSWYLFSVDATDDLGFTAGDEIDVRFRKTDEYGWSVYVDDVYVGDAADVKGLVATNLTGDSNGSKENFSENVPEFTYPSTAKQLASSKSLENFKVYLDDTFMADTENKFYDYEANTTLVPGQMYTAKVTAEYTSGSSDDMTYDFVYLPCDSFNAVEDLVATRVLGTLDVNLTWTNDNSLAGLDEFAGTIIYRDGAFVAELEAGVTTYTDANLESGMYTYCLTQVYESGAESCETCATVEMTAGGFVEGFVYQFGTTTPIADASVALVGTTTTHLFTTDTLGYYAGEVVNDTFNITVSADTYESVMDMDVIVDYGATVAQDYFLKEFPYAVGYVMAEELSDETVKVTWGGETEPPYGEWLTYDDGVNWNALGNELALTMSWAHKFEPAQLTAFTGAAVTQIEGYIGAEAATTIFARVWAGEEAATLLYEEDITSQISWDAWNTITLAQAVPFDNTMNLYIGFYGEDAGEAYPAGLGNTAPYNANGDLFNSGTGWIHANTLGAGDIMFNISGYVTNQFGAKVALNPRTDNTEYKAVPAGSQTIIAAAAPTYREEAIYASKDAEAFVGYNIYRGIKDGDIASDLQFLGSTLDESFDDNTWDDAASGMYRWAVETVYTNNASELVYSNDLDKDMETVVDITVTTNSGDSPGGTTVTFTSVSEPELEAFVVSLSGSGMATVEDFRKGVYTIDVVKAGFAPIAEAATDIFDATSFVWELEELHNPPSDLYVNPLAYATWGGFSAEFTPFVEAFDSQEEFDMWEVIVGGSNAETWKFVDGTVNSLNGTGYAFADSDAAGIGSTMDEILISPSMDASMVSELYIEFDQYYRHLGSSVADVDVYNGTEWITVLSQSATAGAWDAPDHMVLDVTEHANADFRVRFHYDSPGWNWYWAVDNVLVTDAVDAKSAKAVQGYNVYLDGAYTATTEEAMYQYDVEDLVSGQTYLAEVDAIYTSGVSPEKASYEFTYMPCSEFANYNTIMAANVDGTSDVLVEWSMSESPMSLIEINQGYGAPANGYFQSWGLGYGVAFDFTAYPDALVNAVDFHHASWGTTGNWEFKIHVIDWDTKTLIETVGPFTTENNDDWENGIELGDVDCGGAATVALLMEPMGNAAADAYPDLSSDNAADPQGSIYGDLADYNAIGASTIGNFLMNVHIYTGNADAPSMPVIISSTEGPLAQAKAAPAKTTFNPEQVITQNVSLSKEYEVLGVNVYRDGEMIAFVPSPDTFYLDMDLEPGLYDYCVSSVYTDDGGLHTWETCEGDLCIEDVPVTEDCEAPTNLTAEDLLGDGYTATLNWNFGPEAVEYRYDDGMSTGQLGSGAGTMNTVLGNVHRVDSELTEMSWYLTAEGGPHSQITIYVMGLDAAGIPDGNNVLYSALVSNTDEVWNVHTFPTPIDATGGFYLGVAGNGFVAIGTDDGVDDYPFETNTHYFTGDYTANTWDTWETFDFYVNGMIRAIGSPGAVASYAVEPTSGNTTMEFEATTNETAVSVGKPAWTQSTIDSRAFQGFNIYRDNELIEEGYGSTTYLDDIGSSYEVCYYVTAQYEFCGESAATETECVTPGVGVGVVGNAISIYPNPAKDFITVEASSDIRTIKITNYMGQLVSFIQDVEVTSQTIETSSYSSGVYFVEVETAAGVEKVRIVISE